MAEQPPVPESVTPEQFFEQLLPKEVEVFPLFARLIPVRNENQAVPLVGIKASPWGTGCWGTPHSMGQRRKSLLPAEHDVLDPHHGSWKKIEFIAFPRWIQRENF